MTPRSLERAWLQPLRALDLPSLALQAEWAKQTPAQAAVPLDVFFFFYLSWEGFLVFSLFLSGFSDSFVLFEKMFFLFFFLGFSHQFMVFIEVFLFFGVL